jgi:hypothetical protein
VRLGALGDSQLKSFVLGDEPGDLVALPADVSLADNKLRARLFNLPHVQLFSIHGGDLKLAKQANLFPVRPVLLFFPPCVV